MSRRKNVVIGRATIATPECDKVLSVSDKSQLIGEFLEWLSLDGVVMSRWVKGSNKLSPTHEGIEKLLARYFGVDLDERERELRAILAGLRTPEFRGSLKGDPK